MSVYPLSAAQRRLWFVAAFNPASCAYNSTYLIRFAGLLDERRLVTALESIIARHEPLRTTFKPADSGEVMAHVSPTRDVVAPTLDLSDVHATERAAYERRIIEDLAGTPFDLTAGPVLRAALLRFDATTHVLALVVHHIAFDRWSFGVLCSELAMLYCDLDQSASAALPAFQTSYGQCSQAEVEENAGTQLRLAYWRTLLSGERGLLELPTDRARPPIASDLGAVVTVTLDAPLAARVAQVGATYRASSFMTLLAAFIVLMHRYTGQTDILIGTPVAGRGRMEREPLIGLFVNTLPVRVPVARDESFDTVLATVRATVLDMLAHADVPFDRLVSSELSGREGGRNPFFDVVFNFWNTPSTAGWPPELAVQCEDVDTGTSRLDLSVSVCPRSDGSLTCRFEFNRDLFDTTTIEALAARYALLVNECVADPRTSIARVPLGVASEIATIRDIWSRPPAAAQPLPLADSTATVHALVERSAARFPTAPALVEADGAVVTYGELDRRANRLARSLRLRGIAGGARVGLLLDRSAATVIAMLATLKAGGAYVPLDPAYPDARIASMLKSAGVVLIIAQPAHQAAAVRYGLDVLILDCGAAVVGSDHGPAFSDASGDAPAFSDCSDEAPAFGDCSGDARADSVDPDDLAYVMFTSGSTGIPKAVATTHRAIVALITRTPALICTPDDVGLLHAALTFDLSTFLWGPLAYGARLAVMPAGPFSLVEFGAQLASFGVTIVDLSTALFHQLVEERIAPLRDVRRCIVGGDVLSPVHAARFANDAPRCRLYNVYGPTETTVIALMHEVRPGAENRPVPIGVPVADARIYILDALGAACPTGVPGELWIGGSGVARGYLNDPLLTAERFVPDPFAGEPGARMYRTGDRARWLLGGEVAFLGRIDEQVKIRGFRIEPAEIEFALLEHPAVRAAAATVRGPSPTDKQLFAYAEVRDPGVDEATLRAFLQTKLPSHAIPARIVIVASLPLTSSGKLDRQRLPDPVAAPAAADDGAPRGEVEQTLAAIFGALLGVEPIERDADFFALGGHSLIAMRAISRIADATDVDVSLRALFGAPTVAGLATLITTSPRRVTVRSTARETAVAARSPADLDALSSADLKALSPVDLEALSPAELDAMLLQALEHRDVPVRRLRCVVAGESTLVLRCAEILQERGHDVVAALLSPEREAVAWAAERRIPHVRGVDALAGIVGSGDVDYIFSVVNPHVLDARLLAGTKHGGINLHDGPLPRYAGRFATTFALAAGERVHGVTWHAMSEIVDGGPILKQHVVAIDPTDTAFTLNVKCYEAALTSFGELLDDLEHWRDTAGAQDPARRTYFSASTRPSPACIIDFAQTSAAVEAFVRALDFGPTANPVGSPKIIVGERIYRCAAIEVLAAVSGLAPGEIASIEPDGLRIGTLDRPVRLRGLARLGGDAITGAELAAEHGLRAGDRLGGLTDSLAASIAELDRAAARGERQWVRRLSDLRALDPAELRAGGDGNSREHTPIARAGADDFALVAAFAAALLPMAGAPTGDVTLFAPGWATRPALIAALFFGGVPVRLTLDAIGSLTERAAALRANCAEAAKLGPLARDVFTRYPELRASAWSARSGVLPIALAFASEPLFATATTDARLTLLVESDGTRAALLHGSGRGDRRFARELAERIDATLGAAVRAH